MVDRTKFISVLFLRFCRQRLNLWNAGHCNYWLDFELLDKFFACMYSSFRLTSGADHRYKRMLSLIWYSFQFWANMFLWSILHISEISDIPQEACGMCENWAQLMGKKLCADRFLWSCFGFALFLLQISPCGVMHSPLYLVTQAVH